MRRPPLPFSSIARPCNTLKTAFRFSKKLRVLDAHLATSAFRPLRCCVLGYSVCLGARALLAMTSKGMEKITCSGLPSCVRRSRYAVCIGSLTSLPIHDSGVYAQGIEIRKRPRSSFPAPSLDLLAAFRPAHHAEFDDKETMQ